MSNFITAQMWLIPDESRLVCCSTPTVTHHHSPESSRRVERAGQHLPLPLCVQKCISGGLPHRKFIPSLHYYKHMFIWGVQKVKKEACKQVSQTQQTSPNGKASLPVSLLTLALPCRENRTRNLIPAPQRCRWHL